MKVLLVIPRGKFVYLCLFAVNNGNIVLSLFSICFKLPRVPFSIIYEINLDESVDNFHFSFRLVRDLHLNIYNPRASFKWVLGLILIKSEGHLHLFEKSTHWPQLTLDRLFKKGLSYTQSSLRANWSVPWSQHHL